MSTVQKVVLAGASGSVGTTVLEALLGADFTVTVLTRPESSSTFPSNVNVVKADYNDAKALAAAMDGQDAFVSTVGYAAMLEQTKLIDAAVASGVKRLIPSEYGSDPESPARQLPVFGHKVQVEQHIKSKIEGTPTTYTLICNNEFFDWDLDNGFGVNIKEKSIEIFDGGDIPFTATPVPFVARGIVSVLQHSAETANRIVRLHGTTMTQNKLLGLLQRYIGKEGWRVSHANFAEREKEAYSTLQNNPANWMKWAVAFLHCATFNEKLGANFSKNNDNELLGLKELSDTEIEKIVQSRATN